MAYNKSKSGFTLVEMAIVMIIVGILIGALAQPYNIYQKKKKIDATQQHIADVTEKLGQYRSAHGRYPCPAPLNVTRDDPLYGRESADLCVNITMAAGAFTNGYFVHENTRTIDGVNVTQRIRVGAVPFRQLNLDENTAYDGYGGRIQYAVTEELARPGSFNPSRGGIEIIGADGVSIVNPPGSAHFFLSSAGENQAGAFFRSGASLPCPANGPESQNCNLETSGIFSVTQLVTADGVTHFDDVSAYFTASDVPSWQPSTVAGHENDIVQIPVGGGIALLSPMDGNPAAAFDPNLLRIDGRVNAAGDGVDPAGIMAEEACGEDGTGCFPTTKIMGDDALMECPVGQVATRIHDGRVNCVLINQIAITCPDGEFLKGFDGEDAVCEPPPVIECPTMAVNVCGPRTLPNGVLNDTAQLTGGDSRVMDYVCNVGGWALVSASGECTCTPRTEVESAPCGYGYTGTLVQQRDYLCPAGTMTSWVVTSRAACVCVPLRETRSRTCPAGSNTGTIMQERTRSCPAVGEPTWTGWTEYSNTCACAPRSENRNYACGGAQTGRIYETRNQTCPGAVWSGWTETSRTCACTARTETRTRTDCGDGYDGEIQESRTANCATGIWGNWTETSNTCALIPPRTCTLQANGAASGGSTPYGEGPSINRMCNGTGGLSCGSTTNCSRNNGDGTFTNFPSCVCR